MDIIYLAKQLLTNYYFLSFFIAWFFACMLKSFIRTYQQDGRYDIRFGFRSGGMPSSHSAAVSAITVALFLKSGISTLFIVDLIFSLIIISDSFGVRKNVGEQGDAINRWLKKSKGSSIKVVYGHSVLQVTFGILIGILVASILFLAV